MSDRAVVRKLSLDSASVNVALVLDASESATDQRDIIASLALATIASLPASTNCSVFFLGNSTPYSSQKLERNLGQWFDDNQRRASLIGPVLRGLVADGPPSAVAIIGSGIVFDLEDWLESFADWRLILLSLEAPLCASSFSNVSLVSTVEELVSLLHDPIVKVEIATPGMLPLAWTNSAYRLELTDGQFRVLADATKRFDVCLTCDASGAIPKYGLVQRRSGAKTQIAMTSCHGELREPEAFQLSETEANIFRQAIRRKPLACPHCARLHSWETVYCRNTCIPKYRFKGVPLYPSLEETSIRGLVIFRQSRGNVCCEVSKQAVLRLSTNRVLAMVNKKLQLLDYESDSSTWVFSRKRPDPYIALADGRHVLDYR